MNVGEIRQQGYRAGLQIILAKTERLDAVAGGAFLEGVVLAVVALAWRYRAKGIDEAVFKAEFAKVVDMSLKLTRETEAELGGR